MAERPADKQNWQQRQYDSFGPHFRIESGNPEMGENGSVVYNLIGLAADNNTSAIGMNNGGDLHLMNDQAIEIIGGEKAGGGCSINLIGRSGDITITAQSNGSVKITAKNIVIDSDENIMLDAGKDIQLKAGNRIDLNSNVANCDALHGNLAPRELTFAGWCAAGTQISGDTLASIKSGLG